MLVPESLQSLELACDLTVGDRRRFDYEFTLGLVPLGSLILGQPADAIPHKQLQSRRTQQLVERLHAIVSSQRGSQFANKRKGRGMVGLAAPQIGEPWRIMLIDTQVKTRSRGLGKLECFINPHIVWRSRETEEGREGCFSTGPVWGIVRRPKAVKIAGTDHKGRPIERILEGFAARIALHELDHLDGIRFPDLIKKPHHRHWVHSEELSLYDEHFKRWPRVCTEGQWQLVKDGELIL